MSVFADREIRKLFIWLACLGAAPAILIQLVLKLSCGAFDITVLAVSLSFSGASLGFCLRYFNRRKQTLDDAAALLDRFSAGDTELRIESDEEGSLCRLFHAVNSLSAALNAAAAREQREKAFLKDTISDISHQLKTPLAALEIYNSLLREESGDPDAVAEFAEKSGREIERIEALVQSLMKITRLDAGAIVMDRHNESLTDMMEELRDRFESRARREGKHLGLSGPEGAALLCDRVWLMEALSNIVKNAFDHTPKDGNIAIRWDKLPSAVSIVISDDGCGIHPEDIYHIFKRFYRSRFSKDTQGAGLGLPLAKAIIEANDGTIEVSSEPGHGSAFTLRFYFLQNCKRQFIRE